MITVVDIQTNNAYSYGEDNGFDRRVFIIYDGIHYDGEPPARTHDTAAGLSYIPIRCLPWCFG